MFYKPRIAQERAAHRWRCRHLPRRFKDDVRKKVDEMILMDYSPEQIVGVCRKHGIKMKRHGFLSPNQVFSKSTGLDARAFV